MDMRYLRYVKPGAKYYEPPTEKHEESILSATNKPKDWEVEHDGHWTYYFNYNISLPIQGWKIHISSTVKDAQRTLDIVSSFLFKESVPFKHVSNAWELVYKNSKYGHRGSSGKFITIYPINENQFVYLLNKLHVLLKDIPKGPYILSDKRWMDGNVYFRYGAFKEMYLMEGAAKIPAIKTPEGEYIADSREPFYKLPYFIEEPQAIKDMEKSLETLQVEPSELNNYEIKSALHFSNGGGVYLAKRRENDIQFVLKEGRPGAGVDGQGRDAVERLNHEATILKRLKGLKHVVQFESIFKAWEHTFLVEEYISGTPLNTWLAAYYPFSTNENSKEYCRKIVKILKQIKIALEEVHSRGIGMGDLQPANVMVTKSEDVKLIDFESASDITDAKHPGLMTPGFTGAFDLTREQSDWFALSRIARQAFLPIGPVQDLAEDILEKHDRWILRTFGEEALAIIKEIESECKHRGAKPVKSVLSAPREYFGKKDIPKLIKKLRKGIVEGLSENDRLLPGDIRQYESNNGHLNILTGGFGVVMALIRTGNLPTIAKKWVETFSENKYVDKLDEGLFTGKAGIASILYEIGMVNKAKNLYDSLPYNLETKDVSLITGLAGTGLSILSASTLPEFSEVSDQYLKKALDIAERLEDLLEEDVPIQPSDIDAVPVGLIDGWSGVSLFFSALFNLTKDEHWISLADKAIEKDIKQCVLEESGLYQVKDSSRLVPYLAGGSAGIGLAMIALRRLHEDNIWDKELRGIGMLSKSKCFYSPGLFRGLTGLIVFANAIDLELNIKDDCHIEKSLETLNLYLLEENNKFYLPGDYCYRISGDIFSGSSGLLLALNDIQTKKWFSWLPICNIDKIIPTKRVEEEIYA